MVLLSFQFSKVKMNGCNIAVLTNYYFLEIVFLENPFNNNLINKIKYNYCFISHTTKNEVRRYHEQELRATVLSLFPRIAMSSLLKSWYSTFHLHELENIEAFLLLLSTFRGGRCLISRRLLNRTYCIAAVTRSRLCFPASSGLNLKAAGMRAASPL